MNLNDSIQKIQSEKSHPVIFICGLGGSGKTTFAKKLAAEHENAKILELDWYLKFSSKERAQRIADIWNSEDSSLVDQEADPYNWYDWETFKADLSQLQTKGTLSLKSAWNQTTGEKDIDPSLDFNNTNGLIVCEGIYLLHPNVIPLADLVILLNVPKEESRRRADQRDAHRTNSEHLQRKAIILEKYDIPYFETYKKNADFILDRT
jgi:uridine kinase